MCIVDIHVTCSSYSLQYHHLPSLLYAGEAPCTVPPGDESVFGALTCKHSTLCFLSQSWSHSCCLCCHIINFVMSCIIPPSYAICPTISLPSLPHLLPIHHALWHHCHLPYVTMKTTSKKKPVSQAPPTVSPPAPVSTLKTAAASSPPPPVSEESLAKLITLATSSPDLLLGLVWKHAFRKGMREGFRRGTELFKDMDVKQAFHESADEGQIMGILSEREEWETAGHGPWCFDIKMVCFTYDTGLPDGHTCTTKLDAIVQVDFVEAQPASVKTAIQASPSHQSSSSQTTPPLLVNVEAQAQPMDSTPPPTTASTLDPPAFDWSEDATSIPIIPIFPKNQPHHDLSALHTTNPNPFSSLACWNWHHCLPLENRRPSPLFWPYQAPPFFPLSQFIPHWCFIQVSDPTLPPLPSTLLKIPMALDWESNPHLLDLSWALKALGWIHQWSFFIVLHNFGSLLYIILVLLDFFLFQQLEGGRWSRESLLQRVVTCIVDIHVTCSSYSPQYHHLPSLLYAGEAACTIPLRCHNHPFWPVLATEFFYGGSLSQGRVPSHTQSEIWDAIVTKWNFSQKFLWKDPIQDRPEGDISGPNFMLHTKHCSLKAPCTPWPHWCRVNWYIFCFHLSLICVLLPEPFLVITFRQITTLCLKWWWLRPA